MILMLLSLLSPVAVALDCSELSTAAARSGLIREEITRQRKELSPLDQYTIEFFEHRIANATERRCRSKSVCTPEIIVGAVTETLEQFVGRSAKMRSYAILTGSVIAGAVVTSQLSEYFSKNLSFLSGLVGTLTGQIIYSSLGAPIFEPFFSRLRQSVFKSFVRSRQAHQAPSSAELDRIWISTQQNYGPNAQMSRGVINQCILSVKTSLNQIWFAVSTLEDPARTEWISAQLADLLFRTRKLFSDVDPSHPLIRSAARSSFPLQEGAESGMRSRVLERLKSLDPEFGDEKVQKYYHSALQAWTDF